MLINIFAKQTICFMCNLYHNPYLITIVWFKHEMLKHCFLLKLQNYSALHLCKMALRSSEETTNGVKLSRLLIDGGTLALRAVFDGFHPPSKLAAALLSHGPLLVSLNKRKIINQHQWDLLFPSDGSAPDSNRFDITLLFTLLRDICGLTEPAGGWNNLPLPGDNSLEANLARVKYYRNTLYGHVSTTGIDSFSFSHYWREIETTLISLGIDKTEIDRLRVVPLEEELYLKLKLELETQEKKLRALLLEIDVTAEERRRKLEEIQNNQEKLRVNLSQQNGNVSWFDVLAQG